MNQQIPVHQAKMHFAELLDHVSQGETIHITRHGKPVATLLAYHPEETDVAHAVAALRHLSPKTSLKGVKVKALIEAGRR